MYEDEAAIDEVKKESEESVKEEADIHFKSDASAIAASLIGTEKSGAPGLVAALHEMIRGAQPTPEVYCQVSSLFWLISLDPLQYHRSAIIRGLENSFFDQRKRA